MLCSLLTNSPSYANSAHCKIEASWEHHCKKKKKTESVCLSMYMVSTNGSRGTLRDTLPNLTQPPNTA